MSEIESYIVVNLFISVMAFFCGNYTGITQLRSQVGVSVDRFGNMTEHGKKIELPRYFVTEFFCLAISFIYSFMWGSNILGKNFIWLPGLLIWLIIFSYYRSKPVLAEYSIKYWSLSGIIFIPATYHLVSNYIDVQL